MNAIALLIVALFVCMAFAPAALALQPPVEGWASWYGSECCRFNPNPIACPTASGLSLRKLERDQVRFAASWFYPINTRLKITNPINGKSTVAIVLDRGPARRLVKEGRIIDLSRLAFQDIANTRTGLVKVEIEVMP